MRMPLIAGNWKMNGSSALVDEFQKRISQTTLPANVEVVVLPPFPFIQHMKEKVAPLGVSVGAQTLNPEPHGAFTGEVSGAMLGDVGVDYVLVGHSERRTLFHESNEDVRKRVIAAIENGLKPILCVGETQEERESGATRKIVLQEIDAVIASLDAEQRKQLVIAYEPIWAIGSGRTSTPEDAQEVMLLIRNYLREFDVQLGESMRLLYGGSMNADNAGALLAQQDIDGGLIGGASLKVDDFLKICKEAG
ncbi:Triosephosphate isomerase [Halomonadaceae bacterium LMG 33818]|uniref:triose-phosphate isomerase n=1 Tax=Cernens ardua TaxID=3402176 RepID=UPI003EDC049C